jgi:AcrR family transcriptional regulator
MSECPNVTVTNRHGRRIRQQETSELPTNPGGFTAPDALPDHRVLTAQKKREEMRARILDATIRVFAHIQDDAPVIEDVVREAGISRGAFYKHFDSLDQALVAAGSQAHEQMMQDILPLYGFLKEPWQRVAVGFRVFMVRAWQDPKWAFFITRLDTWRCDSRLGQAISGDLRLGRDQGCFTIDDVTVATEFLMGASASTVHAFQRGVADPQGYMEAALRMLFRALDADAALAERAIAFSRKHMADLERGERQAWQVL